jgi:hypothetical protein
MFLNLFRIRIGVMITGILLAGMYFAGGGSFGNKPVIQIEFGMWPEEFEGCEVMIDDEVAGTLRRFGNAFRTGFEVKDGKHTVKLVHPELPSEPVTVTSGAGGRTVLLIADVHDVYRDGRSETTIVLSR